MAFSNWYCRCLVTPGDLSDCRQRYSLVLQLLDQTFVEQFCLTAGNGAGRLNRPPADRQHANGTAYQYGSYLEVLCCDVQSAIYMTFA